jgi:inorganic pyrophosphatase
VKYCERPNVAFTLPSELDCLSRDDWLGTAEFNSEIPMRIDAIARGKNPPEDINVIIEVPVGGHPIKYEMDKDSGALFVDRFLYTPMTYPGNYGFVPHTLSDDGDPIDVLVCSTRPLFPGCVINCRPIGVLKMEDNKGLDEKVIAVPSPELTQRYTKVFEHTDLPEITLKQIEHFFEHYKDLEPGKWVKIGGWAGSAEAKQMIREAVERYDNAKESEKNPTPVGQENA